MEILYILVPSVAIPLAIALLFFFICVCRNNQKSSRPPAPRQPKPVRGQNVEMSMLTTAYKPKVGLCSSTLSGDNFSSVLLSRTELNLNEAFLQDDAGKTKTISMKNILSQSMRYVTEEISAYDHRNERLQAFFTPGNTLD